MFAGIEAINIALLRSGNVCGIEAINISILRSETGYLLLRRTGYLLLRRSNMFIAPKLKAVALRRSAM
jgi:hypothetical protein